MFLQSVIKLLLISASNMNVKVYNMYVVKNKNFSCLREERET